MKIKLKRYLRKCVKKLPSDIDITKISNKSLKSFSYAYSQGVFDTLADLDVYFGLGAFFKKGKV